MATMTLYSTVNGIETELQNIIPGACILRFEELPWG